MSTVVVSGRVDEGVRQKADAVMRNAGLTPTDVIQSIWGAMARDGEIPEFVQPKPDGNEGRAAYARLERFLTHLPPVNPAYADLSDDQILALKVRDYA